MPIISVGESTSEMFLADISEFLPLFFIQDFVDFDFASSSSVASSPGGGGGEDGGGSKVFGSFLVDKHSSTPYTDATQVIKKNFAIASTGKLECATLLKPKSGGLYDQNKLLLFGRKNDRGNAPPLLLSSQSSHN